MRVSHGRDTHELSSMGGGIQVGHAQTLLSRVKTA
jgi:hypothetical protein